MFTDKTLAAIQDTAPYTAEDGTQYPRNFPKSEIPGLIEVTETEKPSDESKIVTGFHIDETHTQVWDVRDKTEEDVAKEVTSALISVKDQAVEQLKWTDSVALRCFKVAVVFPDEWVAYVIALREVMCATEMVALPSPPTTEDGTVAYPEGT